MKTSFVSLLAGLVLIVAGSLLAHFVQTSGGTRISDIRIPMDDGKELSAYLYVPKSATIDTPAPGILAVHGYINSRETQSSFAIELARRGYVVLAMDQSGHGYSTNTAFASAFGGPAGLTYLRSLPFVDASKIGLEGHSMGGWTVLNAAMAMPDAYQSLALVGSSTGAPFAAPGTPEFPRNLAVVFSKYDEFAPLMWEVARAADVNNSGKLQTVFGTDTPVEPERVYGSIEDGTARVLMQPVTTHPGDHLDFGATADVIEWMESTLGAPNPLPANNQVWQYKEMGTALALIGAALSLVSTFALMNLVNTPSARLSEFDTPNAVAGPTLWIALIIGLIVPAATYFTFTEWGAQFPNFGIFRQNITNQIMIWAVANGAIAAIGLLFARPHKTRLNPSGLVSALIATSLIFGVSVLMSVMLKVDFRFWVVALKPLGLHQWPIFLAYFLPFLGFFFASHLSQIRLFAGQKSAWSQFRTAWLMSAGGVTLLIGAVYVALFLFGKLPDFADPLFSIVGIQFIPILTLTAVIAVVSWRTSRSALPGALLSALFVTWYIVAGQATHI